MKNTASRSSLIFAGVVLLAFAVVLTLVRPQHCSTFAVARPISPLVAADSPAPTLAPPPKIVAVEAQSDRSDIVVRWAEN
jgi:hypothetical protein